MPERPDRLAAERRLDFGLGLLDAGDPQGALDSTAAALRADPGFAEAWVALAGAAERQGQPDLALVAYRRYLAAAPEDRLGAIAALVRLGAEPSPPALPPAYLRALFDGYAPRFEQALLDRLGYRGPALLVAALERVLGGGRRWRRGLDLGCGTGLMGLALAGRVEALTGVDLSPAMLAAAAARGLYHRLELAELTAALAAEAAAGARFDLVTAADVLIYLGDLAPVLRGVAAVLAPDGCFAATLERAAEPTAYRLQATQRYAHGGDYIVATAAAAGLRLRLLDADSARREGGQPVPGWTIVLSSIH